MPKTLLILGGYGNAGRAIASLLLQECSDVGVIIAGRNLTAAQEYADKLNEKYNDERARARQVDASSVQSLDEAFQDIDMVVVASSTTAFAHQVLEAGTSGISLFHSIETYSNILLHFLPQRSRRILIISIFKSPTA